MRWAVQRSLCSLCVAAAAILSSASVVWIHAQPAALLNYVVLSDLYYDGLYTNGPTVQGARYVYFVGEQIPTALEIGNPGQEEQTIDTSNVSIDDAFEVVSVKGPTNASGRLALEPTAEVTSARGESIVTWGNAIKLESRSRIVWRGIFRGPSAHGLYQWDIVPKSIRSSTKLNLLGQSLAYGLRRPENLQDRAELARRRMIAAYDRENDVEFEAAARELLNIYPSSSLAFELRGRVAERAGRVNEARAAYEQAIGLLRDGRDELYLKHNATAYVRDNLQGLTESLGRTKSQR